MKTIPELKNVPFEDLEKLYIEQEVAPPLEDMIEDPDRAIKEEYKRVLLEPIYQRALDNDIFSGGGICVQGIGCYPDVSLQTLVLFSIVYRINQEIEYGGKLYTVSIFTKQVLNSAIGANVEELLDNISDFSYCRSRFLLKQQDEKMMFVFSKEA